MKRPPLLDRNIRSPLPTKIRSALAVDAVPAVAAWSGLATVDIGDVPLAGKVLAP